MRWVLGLAVGLALCAGLSACGGSDESKGPGYVAIPDKDLFAQIAAIPGVTQIDLNYRDEFGNGNDYVGEIYVGDDANASAILDQALAILRQGTARASMTVFARQDNRRISPSVFGLNATTDRFLTRRYGPQPGDGLPPETARTPTP